MKFSEIAMMTYEYLGNWEVHIDLTVEAKNVSGFLCVQTYASDDDNVAIDAFMFVQIRMI